MKDKRGIKYLHEGEFFSKGDHPLYRTWYGMHRRCRLSKGGNSNASYLRKGIRVCEEWESFAQWLEDMGPRPNEYTLERLDNARNYDPSNCVWASWAEQGLNREDVILINYKGKEEPLIEVARANGIDRKVLHNRVMCLGWDLDRALAQKVAAPRKRKH